MTACFLRPFAHGPCHGPLQRAHLIPKSRLKAEGITDYETVWDDRVWRPACERHHHLFDQKFFKLGLGDYPLDTLDYAVEVGFKWMGERRGFRKANRGGASCPACGSPAPEVRDPCPDPFHSA